MPNLGMRGNRPGGGSSLRPKAVTVAAGFTGVVTTLRTSIKGTLTYSKVSGAASLTVNAASGALTLGSALAEGASVSAIFRVSNGTDAVETGVTVTGAVVTAPLSISGTIPATATVGTAFPFALGASGGTPPYTFSIFAGALPAGVVMSGAGVGSGTPTTAATYSGIVARVTDSLGATANLAAVSVVVTAAAGVAPASVNTRGLLITMASNPGVDTLDQAETIVRSGYTAAGGATLTTWQDPMVIRKRARVAGATSPTSLRTLEYVSSKALLPLDTLLGRTITNSSTRTAPLIAHRWVTRANYVADTGDTSSAAFGTVGNRNGVPIAFVVFKWDDGTTSVTTTVTAPSKYACALTGFVGQVYTAAAPAGWSSLLDGQIRKTYTAYGHYGQVITNDVTPTSWYGAEPYPQFIRKKTGFVPVYVFLSATGVVSGGAASVTIATARAGPWLTTNTTAYSAAMNAAISANNAANGINALDGVIICLSGDGTGAGNIGPLAGGLTSKNCFIGGVTFQADPIEYTSYVPTVELNGMTARFIGSTTPGSTQGILFDKLRIVRTNASTLSTILGMAGQMTEVRFRNGGYDGGAVTAACYPLTNGAVVFENCTLTGFLAAASSHLLGTGGTFIRGFINCINTDGMNSVALCANFTMGCKFKNVRLSSNLTVGLEHGHLTDATFVMASLPVSSNNYVNTNGAAMSIRAHVSRNSLIEMCNAAEGQRWGNFSADGGGGGINLNTVGYANCAYPGSCGDGSLAGSSRRNYAYLDTANDPRVHSWTTESGCLMPMTANKGDKFGGTTANNYDGWSEYGNGVGSAGNFLSRVQPSYLFGPDYYGIGGTQPATGATEVLPGYTDPKVPTVMNGSDTAGGGTYTYLPGAAAIGSVSYIPEVLWDVLGNDMAAGVVRHTPGPFAGLYT